MISLPSIVMVDDNKEELAALQDSFIRSGYPCFPIHYQSDDPENISGIDHVKLDSIKPRVIITDINLIELQKVEATTLVSSIAEVLKKLVNKGPYILYFWSKNEGHAQKIIELLEERYSDSISYPLHWGVLSKSQFFSPSNRDELVEKVQKLLAENPIFSAFFDWENRVTRAAQNTTDSLYQLARPKNSSTVNAFQDQVASNLNKLLSAIGNEAIGESNAKDSPELAVENGLAPVLHDQINSISGTVADGSWKDAAPDIGTKVSIEHSTATKLNSFCHIEEVEAGYSKACRGVFLELEAGVLDNTAKRSKLEQRLGAPIDNIVDEEFLAQIVNKANKKRIREATTLGFVEISAECDQAQKKTKLHRYVLAAITPLSYDGYDIYGKQSKKSHNGIYRVPDAQLDGKDIMLQLSFKYQIGALPSENTWLGRAKLRLRDQIMTEISFNCAQYMSRPGIIRFQS